MEKIIDLIEKSKFSPKSRLAAYMRMVGRLPYADIAKTTGVNRERIRQIVAALNRRLSGDDPQA